MEFFSWEGGIGLAENRSKVRIEWGGNLDRLKLDYD